MKTILLFFGLIVMCSVSTPSFGDETFKNGEANFNLVMKKLLASYVDKNVTADDLYRAATAGMLASLNTSAGDDTSNKLLSPDDVKNMEVGLSGKVTGIGVTIKFDDHTGYGLVLNSLPGSPAEKSGLKTDDQILSVDGQRFKGKHLLELATAIRGEVGGTVTLKVLREDRIITFHVKRELMPWSPTDFEKIDAKTALLDINFFNRETPKIVREKLSAFNHEGFKKLIVDVRDNEGGGFDEAIATAGLFLPADAVVARTTNRSGDEKVYHAKGGLLGQDVQIIVLVNKGTFCGAELFAEALKENRGAKLVGETTFGKWDAQDVEPLPNQFAIKYTVSSFRSSHDLSFQGKGIKPDLEVALPQGSDVNTMRAHDSLLKRTLTDDQLKAAVELIEAS